MNDLRHHRAKTVVGAWHTMLLLVLGIGLVVMGCRVETEEAMADMVSVPDTTQQRYVEGNVFTSTYLPAIRIEIDEALSYVGMMDFILKDIAQVERYVFVEADAQQRITRMIVFPFEGFLDNNDHYYRYRFIDPDTLGGLAFNHNTSKTSATAATPWPRSPRRTATSTPNMPPSRSA